MDEQKIKEYLFQAVQSGKKETSNLADDILKKMDSRIQERINNTVFSIQKELNEYMIRDFEWKEQDKIWKDEATPLLKVMEKFEGFTATGGWVLKAILLIGGAISVVYGGIIFIKNLLKVK